MKFINPDTPSIVVGRAATSSPIPENVKASRITMIKETAQPRTSHRKTKDEPGKDDNGRDFKKQNTRRESMNESR